MSFSRTPLILNLSALHTPPNILKAAWKLAVLSSVYSEGFICPLPRPLSNVLNFIWVMYHYYQHLNSTINPYKKGEKSTKDFLKTMGEVFPFLPEGSISRCWNEVVDYGPDEIERLQKLLKLPYDICLITNSNPLNIFKNLEFFKEAGLELDLPRMGDMLEQGRAHPDPIALKEGLSLLTSFQKGEWKTTGLLQDVVTWYEARDVKLRTTIQMASQFKPDRIKAGEYLLPQNIFTARQFFNDQGINLPQKQNTMMIYGSTLMLFLAFLFYLLFN